MEAVVLHLVAAAVLKVEAGLLIAVRPKAIGCYNRSCESTQVGTYEMVVLKLAPVYTGSIENGIFSVDPIG